MQQTLRTYYRLTKPGIIYGNLLTSTAGFLLAARGSIDVWLLVATLAGIALTIAGACVCNNYIDRHIDAKMKRTKGRALVTGKIHAVQALSYALILEIVGFSILALYTNLTVVVMGLLAVFTYIVLYGIGKRTTTWGTIIGSVAGALPPAAGYVAASGSFDLGAMLVFLVLTFWQMPHFYAIAIYRLGDYKAAGLSVLPVKKGIATTKARIIGYVIAFGLVTALLAIYGFATRGYLVVMGLVSLAWLAQALRGYRTMPAAAWARRLFFFSLIVLLAWSATVSVDSFFR